MKIQSVCIINAAAAQPSILQSANSSVMSQSCPTLKTDAFQWCFLLLFFFFNVR